MPSSPRKTLSRALSCSPRLRISYMCDVRLRKTVSAAKGIRGEAGAEWLCVLAWPNMGDAYIVARMLETWEDRDRALILTHGNSAYEVLRKCGFRAKLLDEPTIRGLVRASYFLGESETRIRILHYGPAYSHIGITRNLLGFRGTTFYSLLNDCVFAGKGLSDLPYPFKTRRDGTSRDSVPRVFMNPESNTLKVGDGAFWGEIAARLGELGVHVTMNSADDRLAAHANVTAFRPPLDEAVGLACSCDCVVMARSGFSDLISGSEVGKIILYPQRDRHTWGVGSALAAWTLKGVDAGSTLMELEVNSVDPGDCVPKIVRAATACILENGKSVSHG